MPRAGLGLLVALASRSSDSQSRQRSLKNASSIFATHPMLSKVASSARRSLFFKSGDPNTKIKKLGWTQLFYFWCPGPDLNRHARLTEAQDFKSCASTNFATGALMK